MESQNKRGWREEMKKKLRFSAFTFNTAMVVLLCFWQYHNAEYQEDFVNKYEYQQPEPIPFPGGIPDIPDRPWPPEDPDDPDEENYEVL